jgi:hypothetical protein
MSDYVYISLRLIFLHCRCAYDNSGRGIMARFCHMDCQPKCCLPGIVALHSAVRKCRYVFLIRASGSFFLEVSILPCIILCPCLSFTVAIVSYIVEHIHTQTQTQIQIHALYPPCTPSPPPPSNALMVSIDGCSRV